MFRRDVHVIEDFDDTRAREWFCALDYGFTRHTVALLACTDCDGNVFVVDEHAQRLWLPERHSAGIQEMPARHQVRLGFGSSGGVPLLSMRTPQEPMTRPLVLADLARFVAGSDVFSRQTTARPSRSNIAAPGSVCIPRPWIARMAGRRF